MANLLLYILCMFVLVGGQQLGHSHEAPELYIESLLDDEHFLPRYGVRSLAASTRPIAAFARFPLSVKRDR
jgi:hypothetical protein